MGFEDHYLHSLSLITEIRNDLPTRNPARPPLSTNTAMKAAICTILFLFHYFSMTEEIDQPRDTEQSQKVWKTPKGLTRVVSHAFTDSNLSADETRPNSWAKQVREIEWGYFTLDSMTF